MSYDYKKIFFQRPILTQMNLFFWWFLFFTVLWIVPLTIVLAGYFANLSDELLRLEYRKYTINRLLQIPRTAIIEDNVEISELHFGKLPQDLEIHGEPERSETDGAAKTPKIMKGISKKNPLKKYQESKKVYEENIERFAVNKDDKVQISQPNFTDFGVVQGYRSFEETLLCPDPG